MVLSSSKNIFCGLSLQKLFILAASSRLFFRECYCADVYFSQSMSNMRRAGVFQEAWFHNGVLLLPQQPRGCACCLPDQNIYPNAHVWVKWISFPENLWGCLFRAEFSLDPLLLDQTSRLIDCLHVEEKFTLAQWENLSKNWKRFKGIIRKTLNHSILLPNGEKTRANKLLGAASKLSKDDREQASTQGK